MRKRVALALVVIGFMLPLLANGAAPSRSTDFKPEYDVDQWIGGWNYYAVYITLDQGDTIYVEIEVTSGAGIDFFICDQDNFDIYQSLGSPDVYQQAQNVGKVSTSFSVPTSGTWYCIFFNDDLFSSKHIEGYVGTSPLLIPGNLGPVVFAFVFFGICAAIIIGVIKMTQKPEPAPYPPPSQSPPPVYPPTTNYCPYCGTPRQSMDTRFCANCGRAFDGPSLG